MTFLSVLDSDGLTVPLPFGDPACWRPFGAQSNPAGAPAGGISDGQRQASQPLPKTDEKSIPYVPNSLPCHLRARHLRCPVEPRRGASRRDLRWIEASQLVTIKDGRYLLTTRPHPSPAAPNCLQFSSHLEGEGFWQDFFRLFSTDENPKVKVVQT